MCLSVPTLKLVAPVTVGKGATIAAGTTVTRNVGENALAISRVPQTRKKAGVVREVILAV